MAASWVLAHSPWSHLARTRLKVMPWPRNYLATSSHASNIIFNSSFLPEEHPSMLAMRNRPYPTEGWDSALFEDPVEELQAISTPYEAHRPCQMLAQLVREKKFAEATVIRRELGQMGISIVPDAVYAGIAVDEALRAKHESPLERISAFMDWWSLVPQPDKTDILWQSQCLQDTVLANCHIPDSRHVLVAALHVARHRHPEVVAKVFMSYMIPNSSQQFITALLSDVCTAGFGCPLARVSQRSIFTYTVRRRYQRLYDQTIMTLCAIRRPDDALQVMRQARDNNLTLAEKTYSALLLELRRVQDTAGAAIVQTFLEENIGSQLTDAPPQSLVQDDYVLQDAFVEIEDLLKINRLPSVAKVSLYIRHCLSSGNYTALGTLRSRCLESSRAREILPRWAREEMQFFMDAGQKKAVLATFEKYFSVVGTPSHEWFLRAASPRQSRYSVKQRLEDPRIDAEHYVPAYLHNPSPILAEKMKPTRFHNIYVWHALARMSNRQTLEKLYNEFIQLVAEQSSRSVHAHAPSTTPPPGTEHRTGSLEVEHSKPAHGISRKLEPFFDTVHFNIFIRAFTLRGQPIRAYRVLEDMGRLEVNPDFETYSTLVNALTGGSYLRHVLAVLDLAEHIHLPYTPGYRGVARTDDALERRPSTHTLILTTSALTKYLDQSQLDFARCIKRRLESRLGYKIGTNPIVDAALQRFSDMWKSGKRTVPAQAPSISSHIRTVFHNAPP